MSRLVFVILTLFPLSAYADPVTFFASVGTFLGSTAIAATAVTAAITWGQIAFMSAMVLYGQSQQRRAAAAAQDKARQSRDDFNASLKDRMASGIATEFPYRYVYGKSRVGANVVAIFSSGVQDEYKHIVAVFAQQESEAIEEIWISGKPVGVLNGAGVNTSGAFLRTETITRNESFTTNSFQLASSPVAGSLTILGTFTGGAVGVVVFTLVGTSVSISSEIPGPFTASYQTVLVMGMVRVAKHLGGATDPADPNLRAEMPAKWPATAVLRGHTYIVLRLDLHQAEFQGGLPPIEALIKGKKLYDPRTGLSVWSDNNALVAFDYLTSQLGGVPTASVPVSQFIAAANDCDDIVNTGAWSDKRYTFNGAVSSDDAREDILDKIAQSMAGGIVATTWDIYAGKYAAPVMALYQEDIVGEVAISPGYPRNDIYNTVKGAYVGAENQYVVTDYRPYVNSAYLSADGEELSNDISLPFTDTQQRCTNLARIFTEDNRNSFCMSGKFSLKTWSLRVGQRVTFTSAFFGQTAKVFRLTDKSCAPDRMMQLGFKEDAASIYDLADETSLDATPNTDLPNIYSISALASLDCQSGTASLLQQSDGSIISRIHVTWPAAATSSVLLGGLIELEYQVFGKTDWQQVQVSGGSTSAYLAGVSDGSYYLVRARCLNPYVGVYSDWVYAQLHRVVGKTEPPPAFDIFTVMAQPDGTRQYNFGYATLDKRPADWLGAKIRYVSGTNEAPDWEAMTPLQDTATHYTSSPVELNAPLSGVYTFACKSVDTTGNASAYLIRTLDLPNRRLGDVFDEVYEHSNGWPGVITAGHTQGTIIEANDTATWATVPATFAEWLSWSTNPATEISYVTVPTDFGTSLAAQINSYIVADGTVVQEKATSQDGITWSAWSSATTAFDARYLKLRLTVTATEASPVPAIKEWNYTVNVIMKSEYINDLVVASLTGVYRLGVGDIRIPLGGTYSVIKRTTVVVQDGSVGTWTYVRIDQSLNPSPRWQFRLDGVLTDPAFVDFYIEGY